jgi:hypothetical protein
MDAAVPPPTLLQQCLSNWNIGADLVLSQLTALPKAEAVRQLLEREHKQSTGLTVLHCALHRNAPLKLDEAISDIMAHDDLKTNVFAVSTLGNLFLPCHFCAVSSTSVDVLQFVIDRYPPALLKRDRVGLIPSQYAQSITYRENRSSIVRCLEVNTTKYKNLRNQTIVKLCLIDMKRSQSMTEFVAATPINELSPSQFVFMVLDNMVNREMKLMADDVLSYVGG